MCSGQERKVGVAERGVLCVCVRKAEADIPGSKGFALFRLLRMSSPRRRGKITTRLSTFLPSIAPYLGTWVSR